MCKIIFSYPNKKLSTWVYTIAGNLAKNELRNRSRNPLVLFQAIKKNWESDHRPLEWEDYSFKPDDLYHKRLLKDLVEKAVTELPEHHRIVFVLRELEGKTYDEIAERLQERFGQLVTHLEFSIPVETKRDTLQLQSMLKQLRGTE